uniref:C2H2-type domain-containing protein n=1 Tax=Glossina pallidipes TaxID=7398 RepID=A0A1B0A2D6_GLOPL
MDLSFKKVEHLTPTPAELRPYQKIKCSQPGCEAFFHNHNNYEMHLEKRHKLPILKKMNPRLYYCPEDNCVYRYGSLVGKHFKTIKYLKQHYQKVHMPKDFSCTKCGKTFIKESQLRVHQQELCGKKFVCKVCTSTYDSIEALLTHGKRKGHAVRDVVPLKKNDCRVPTKSLKLGKHSIIKKDRQRDEPKDKSNAKLLCATSVQTDTFVGDESIAPVLAHTNLDDINLLLKDIETQTEPFMNNSSDNNSYLDPMLAQSSHMYTQTCDEFLSELGLSDIQTQTNWPSPSRDSPGDTVQFISTATSTNPYVHDELLVSTETQTSFTQCLLNSCSEAQTTNSAATAVTATTDVPFGSLYHTQHTQTCDPLLDSFDFVTQHNDLIDGFQSTYTQT